MAGLPHGSNHTWLGSLEPVVVSGNWLMDLTVFGRTAGAAFVELGSNNR